jgi:hypothetical protein
LDVVELNPFKPLDSIPKLPSEIWQIILENNEYRKLCHQLSDNANINKVRTLAIVYGIPLYTLDGSERSYNKTELCHRLATAIKSGKKEWTPQSEANFRSVLQSTDTKYRDILRELHQLARNLGWDINDPHLQAKLQHDLQSLPKLL